MRVREELNTKLHCAEWFMHCAELCVRCILSYVWAVDRERRRVADYERRERMLTARGEKGC